MQNIEILKTSLKKDNFYYYIWQSLRLNEVIPDIINNWFKTVRGCEQRLFSTGFLVLFLKLAGF